MKKLTIRMLALLMAILMIVPMLAGCNTSGDDKEEGRKAEPLEGETIKDLGGYEFHVYDYFTTRWEPEAGTEVNDTILQIMDDVEELYNCDIVFHELNVNEVFTQVQPAVAAGDKFGDVIICTMWAYGPLLGAGGLLGDIGKVEGLNLDKPWWNKNIMDTCTIDGQILGGGATFTDHSYLTWSCYFNKTMFQQLGHDPNELYKLVRNGEWTYDKFRAYAKEALLDQDNSGAVDSAEDRWGLVAPGGDYNRAAFLAMGGKFYDHNENGKLVFAGGSQHAISVVEFMRGMFKDDKIWMDSAGEPFQDIMQHFVDGHSLFIMCSPGEQQLKDREDDFGFLPQPKWDAAQENYIGMVDHNAPVFCITSTNQDLDKMGYVMEAVARRYEAVNEFTLQDWADTLWRTPADDEMMRTYVYKHGGYDLAPIAQNANSQLGAPMNWVMNATMGASTDYASQVDAVKDVLAVVLDDFASGALT